jgi:hypothetical protein
VIATAFEALHTIPAPSAGAHTGSLTLASATGAALGADVSRACDAVDSVASVRDALQSITGVPNAAADRVLRVATSGPHASDLDRALAEWIAMVDALAASTVLDPVAAAAARAKADILIEAMSQTSDASSARYALAVELTN